MSMEQTRRRFLKSSVIGIAAVGAGACIHRAGDAEPEAATHAIPHRVLGRTGRSVPIIGIGCGSQFLAKNGPDETDAILTKALEVGTTYWDTASSYGPSQARIGRILRDNRDKVFVSTKTDRRDYDGAMRDLHASLKALQTDHLDLWQMHDLEPPKSRGGQSVVDVLTGDKGAARAFHEMKEQGVVKAIGITGHSGADILMEAIKRIDPDTVLTVFNAARLDGPAGGYEQRLLPFAHERNMGVIAMKTVRKVRPKPGVSNEELIAYALALPITVAIVGTGKPEHVEANARLACSVLPTPEQMDALHRKMASAAWDGSLPYLHPNYRDGGYA